MASTTNTTLEFFTKATPEQWSYIFNNYSGALKAKAARRTKKGGPEELIRLDSWYQDELPKLIHSRKELYITHEELVQLTKWKLMREKFRPNLIDLVRINTEKAVLTHSKKAFKRMPNLAGAIAMLTCLKGVGPATASAILATVFPDQAPFMADECMISTPGVETMDYSMAEYLNYTSELKKKADYLNSLEDPSQSWNPHKIELALWAHFVAGALEASILADLPLADEAQPNSNSEAPEKDANDAPTPDKTEPQEPKKTSLPDEDSLDTIDSFASCEASSDAADYSCKGNGVEPPAKKCRV